MVLHDNVNLGQIGQWLRDKMLWLCQMNYSNVADFVGIPAPVVYSRSLLKLVESTPDLELEDTMKAIINNEYSVYLDN